MKIKEIFASFMGEHSILGIGASVIILRTHGCNLNCWGGCDTPEAVIEKGHILLDVERIFNDIKTLAKTTGCRAVMLTGGEPLLQHPQELQKLLTKLIDAGFFIIIKTNGTQDTHLFNLKGVYFVIDYKDLPSIRIDGKDYSFKVDVESLTAKDIIQYVIKTDEDYTEAVKSIREIRKKSFVGFTMGAFWGKDSISPLELFDKLKKDGLLNDVRMNFQVHKLAQFQNELVNKKLLKSI